MSSVNNWLSTYQRQADSLIGAGLPWLETRRKRAMDQFAEMGWPTSRHEGWRHTSLAVLQQEEFISDAAPVDIAAVRALLEPLQHGEPGHWLVFVDGRFMANLSDMGTLPEGARVMPMSQALTSHADLIEDLNSEADKTAPAALNMAMAGDGGFVSVARGVVLEHPVHLVFVTATARHASFPRNLVAADNGSQATVVEHYLSVTNEHAAKADASLTNAVTRMRVASDAVVTHMKLQREDEQAFHLASISAEQGERSTFNSHSMSFGARLARNDITTAFSGKHCETLLNGLYYVNGRRHVDHNTMIDHAHPDGISREYYRGILADAGRGVFGGRILVAPGADGTDAVQRSDSLLLSRLARADARPELEIYADDVKCAHGATVGQIDDDAMFYLRTRGLDDTHARNLLTYAFAVEAIERISVPGLRRHVAGLIRARLPGGAVLGDVQ